MTDTATPPRRAGADALPLAELVALTGQHLARAAQHAAAITMRCPPPGAAGSAGRGDGHLSREAGRLRAAIGQATADLGVLAIVADCADAAPVAPRAEAPGAETWTCPACRALAPVGACCPGCGGTDHPAAGLAAFRAPRTARTAGIAAMLARKAASPATGQTRAAGAPQPADAATAFARRVRARARRRDAARRFLVACAAVGVVGAAAVLVLA